MNRADLDKSEYNNYYQTYINKTEGLSLLTGLSESYGETYNFLKSIPQDRLGYRYEKGKWTIKEVVQHLLDTERVFAYRALRIGRGDNTPLAGFNQDDYIEPSKANERSIEDLLKEYSAVRKATEILFKSLPVDALQNLGIASNADVSVRAIGFIIIGHERHHCQIIRERYLNALS